MEEGGNKSRKPHQNSLLRRTRWSPCKRFSGFNWSGFRVSSFGGQVQAFGFRISGFGFRVSGFGFRVSGFGIRDSGFGFEVSEFGFRVSGFGFRVSDLGFRVSGFGFRVPGSGVRVSGFGRDYLQACAHRDGHLRYESGNGLSSKQETDKMRQSSATVLSYKHCFESCFAKVYSHTNSSTRFLYW